MYAINSPSNSAVLNTAISRGDFPRWRRPHHTTLEHCTMNPPIEHHHTYTFPNDNAAKQKKTGVLRRSWYFFVESWQRRAGGRTDARSVRAALIGRVRRRPSRRATRSSNRASSRSPRPHPGVLLNERRGSRARDVARVTRPGTCHMSSVCALLTPIR
ncbi:unnamed protein product, partial [Brenthis ino]